MATVYFDGSTDGVLTTAGNWSTGVVPAANEDVVIDGNMFPSTVTALTGNIVAAVNSVTICNTSATFGTAAAPLVWVLNGAGSFIYDAGTGSKYLTVTEWAEWAVLAGGAIVLGGTSTVTNRLLIRASSATVSVGVATSAGAVTLEATEIDVQAGTVNIGRGWLDFNGESALSTLTMQGGTVTSESPAAAVDQYGGTLTWKEGAVTTWDLSGGTGKPNGTGTITTLNVRNGARAEFSEDLRAKTVTTANMYAGSNIQDTNGIVVWTNPINLIKCSLADVTLNVGKNRKLTIADI